MSYPNERLLTSLANDEGYIDIDEMLADAVTDSVVPGICTKCKGAETCEPDADANWCSDCGTQTVKSCLVLAELI
jgi:hypothetical protein